MMSVVGLGQGLDNGVTVSRANGKWNNVSDKIRSRPHMSRLASVVVRVRLGSGKESYDHHKHVACYSPSSSSPASTTSAVSTAAHASWRVWNRSCSN